MACSLGGGEGGLDNWGDEISVNGGEGDKLWEANEPIRAISKSQVCMINDQERT